MSNVFMWFLSFFRQKKGTFITSFTCSLFRPWIRFPKKEMIYCAKKKTPI